MPLVYCHECRATISDTAASCPHCGVQRFVQPQYVQQSGVLHHHVTTRQATSPVVWGCLAMLLLPMALGIIGAIVAPSTPGVPAAPSVEPPSATQPSTPAPVPTSEWLVDESRSEMDDSRTVRLALPAVNEVQGWLTSERPTLIIRCEERETDVIVRTGMAAQPEYGRYSEARVEVRLDSGAVRKQWWSEATNNEALFSPQPIAFAKQLARSRRLRFRFSAFNAGARTAEFDLAGLSDVLPKVAAACGWTYP